MPWIWIGGKCFNLSRVEVVHCPEGQGTITIVMFNGSEVALSGDDASDFVREWEEFAQPRRITRAPPRILRPTSIAPEHSD